MADVIVRRNGNPIQPSTVREMDPIRTLRDLLRWDPFQEMAPRWPIEGRGIVFTPAFDVKETKDSYLFKADIPGVRDADVAVTLTGNRLTISGKRDLEREEQGDSFFTCERSHGSFRRSFTLPDGADAGNVHVDLRAGVLTLVLPKRPEIQPRRILVRSEKGGSPS